MSPRQTTLLLDELCVDFGFCLTPNAQVRLQEKPEADADAFTDAVIRAEGLDPDDGVSLNLRRKIKAVVDRHFKAAEEDGFSA